MRLPALAAFALLALGGCTGVDYGWHVTKGIRWADGTIVPKQTPVPFQTDTLASDTGAQILYISGDKNVRLASANAEPQGAFNRFGGVERDIPLVAWRGQRIRVALRLKNEGAARAYFLVQLNRVDGDAIRTRAQRNAGSDVWQALSFVLDVPDNATDLFLYAGFTGNGAIWVDGLTLEKVGRDVAVSPTISLRNLVVASGGYGGYNNCYGGGCDNGYYGFISAPGAASPMAQSTIRDIQAGSTLK